MNITAIIVTYNRHKLLKSCIESLLTQSHAVKQIIIVDNASTDGTSTTIQAFLDQQEHKIEYIRLEKNLGGAGGFSRGIQHAVETNAEWIWIMDDDASPSPNALEELTKIVETPHNVYGSIAISGTQTSWLTTFKTSQGFKTTSQLSDVPPSGEVDFLPFLGFLIHKSLVHSIGLPDADFFIAADDVEYCMRAKRSGSKIMVAGKSHITHPKADNYTFNIPFVKKLHCLALPPWKRYYDTRNRIFIAKKYYGLRWLYQTLPGSSVRLVATLIHEPNRARQTWAFFAGIIDGICNKKGQRHSLWKIK